MKKVVIMVISFVSVLGLAQEGSSRFVGDTNTSGNVQRGPPKANTGPSIHDASRMAQQQNDNAGKSASNIGTMLTVTGGAIAAMSCPQPHGQAMCRVGIGMVVMGGLAMMQAGQHGGTSAGAGYSGSATDGMGGLYNDGYSDGNKVGNSDFGTFDDYGAKVAKDLAKKGVPVKFDSASKKFVLPDGKKIGAEDVSSPGAMAAAGFSASDIAAVQGKLAAIEKDVMEKNKLSVPAFGYEEGGGGGGFGSGGVTSGSGAYGSAETAVAADRGISSINAKAEAQGLSKNYNGEPIGVANDSIFNMMTRRYKLKDKQDAFFLGNELVLQK